MKSLVLGIMSGTSLDGVDCVLTAFDGGGAAAVPRLERWWSRRFPRGLRERLKACAEGRAAAWDMGQVHHDLGRFYARVARDGWRGESWTAVGLHGQTVYHAPEGPFPATCQLGEPAYLAAALGVPVVSNFRAADVAMGGQGAPMATLFHARVFARRGRHVCVQNLGGIGNVTSLDGRGRGRPMRVRSFDTGPGNLLIDGAVERLSGGRCAMDRGGRWASRGTVDAARLDRWLRHPFLRRPPPKSTGREVFGAPWLETFWPDMDDDGLDPADRLATLTEFTAAAVEENYRRHLEAPPDEVILCGGGARNPFLVARLTARLRTWSPGVEVVTCAARGWPPETVEGAAFALLARERLSGRPGNLPETTGARAAVGCGQVTDLGRGIGGAV